MVNIFPELLSYSALAPFLLRLLVAVIFMEFAYAKLTHEKHAKSEFFEKIGFRPGATYVVVFAIIELLIGVALLLGFYTQLAALLAALILLGTLIIKRKHPALLPSELRYYFILFIISLTILFTGAGAYSIDLPL